MSNDILFLAEFSGGAPARSALELASGAAELASQSGGAAVALAYGSSDRGKVGFRVVGQFARDCLGDLRVEVGPGDELARALEPVVGEAALQGPHGGALDADASVVRPDHDVREEVWQSFFEAFARWVEVHGHGDAQRQTTRREIPRRPGGRGADGGASDGATRDGPVRVDRIVEIEMRTLVEDAVTVGPGSVVVTLPS